MHTISCPFHLLIVVSLSSLDLKSKRKRESNGMKSFNVHGFSCYSLPLSVITYHTAYPKRSLVILFRSTQDIEPITIGICAWSGSTTASSILGPEAIPAGTVIGGTAGCHCSCGCGRWSLGEGLRVRPSSVESNSTYCITSYYHHHHQVPQTTIHSSMQPQVRRAVIDEDEANFRGLLRRSVEAWVVV